MAQPITIKMDTQRYVAPDEEDVAEGKSYARKRNEAILALLALLRSLLEDATERLVKLFYRSSQDALNFTIDTLEEELMAEFSNIMDELEDSVNTAVYGAILKIPLLDSSTTQNYLTLLTSYLANLGHNNKNFKDTLFTYLMRYSRDVEAYVAAAKFSELPLSEALTKIEGSIGQIGAPTLQEELNAAYAEASQFSAPFINSRGEVVDYDGTRNSAGIPKDGMMAILNSINIALSMLYGKAQLWEFEDKGAVGYYQLRGSQYPCTICDSEVGFHNGDINNAEPLPHPHCMCYRIPIYNNTQYRPLDIAQL